MKLKERFKTILKNLNEGIYEKEEVIALSLLSAIAGESIFLLGPPGVAKSLIARRLKNIFKDGKSFEYLMSRFSTPDEIFGPVSISKLKNEDKYVRLTENYLPNADIVFLDEIWKAGPSIQNTLLTVINEKLFRNGDKDEKVKMKSLISASNELPASNEGLEALWDRFLIRYFVDGITDNDSFFEMIDGNVNINDDAIKEDLKITDKEYQDWQNSITKVKIPDEVKNVIKAIRFYLSEYNSKNENDYIYISDRRWKKIIKILKTSAFMNEREEVNLMDVFLIAHLIWNNDSQIDLIKEMVAKAVKEHSFNQSLGVDEIIAESTELKLELEEEERRLEESSKLKIYSIKGVEYYRLENKIGENYYFFRKQDIKGGYLYNALGQSYDSVMAGIHQIEPEDYWVSYEISDLEKNVTIELESGKLRKESLEFEIPPQNISKRLILAWRNEYLRIKDDLKASREKLVKLSYNMDVELDNFLIIDEKLSKIPKDNILLYIERVDKEIYEIDRDLPIYNKYLEE